MNSVKALKTLGRKGFSLVEMLIVIAVIGILAAIAIPSIGTINESAKQAAAKRNAQNVASIINSGLAAGASFTAITNGATAIAAAVTGGLVTDSSSSFYNKRFKMSAMPANDVTRAAAYLSYDSTSQAVNYNSTATPVTGL